MTPRDLELKLKGELAFTRLVMMILGNGGGIDRVSTTEEDRYGHWDILARLKSVGSYYRIDCKSIKSDNPRYHYVEFVGNTGYPGWLYGEADYIAFELESGFLLTPREELRTFAEAKVDRSRVLDYVVNYKLYSRVKEGKADQVSRVPTSDLFSIKGIKILN